jgi:hypothetical protein
MNGRRFHGLIYLDRRYLGRRYLSRHYLGCGFFSQIFLGKNFFQRIFEERLRGDRAGRATRRDLGEHLVEQGLLARVHLGWRRLFVPVVVIVVACPAANFGGLAVQQRYHRVVHDALALHAKVVDDVA